MKTESRTRLPTVGQIVTYLFKSFGVPNKGGAEFKYEKFKRLKHGGLEQKTQERLAREVIDAIFSVIANDEAEGSITTELLTKVHGDPLFAKGWPLDEEGKPIAFRGLLVRDLIEFLWRHQYLADKFGAGEQDRAYTFVWLSSFVIPFVAANLVEYEKMGLALDQGMPAGRLWLVPDVRMASIRDKSEQQKPVIVWPVNQVLEWWQDLLGDDLENFGIELCGNNPKAENSSRQIREWLKGVRVPSEVAIKRWVSQSWNYKGSFVESPNLNLSEQWALCREFLIRKEMDKPPVIPFPDRPDTNILKSQQRGERLDMEILRFPEFKFSEFFSSPDPIAAGMPVAGLIRRVSIRWQKPTAAKLRAVLFFARAAQTGWTDITETLGRTNALNLMHWTTSAYNLLMEAHNEARVLSPKEIARNLRQFSHDPAHPSLAWIYDEELWHLLPSHMCASVVDATKR